MEKIDEIRKRFEMRAKCTQQAKKDLQKILNWVTEQVQDAVSGYASGTSFICKYSYWDGGSWVNIETECYFALYDGKAEIMRLNLDRPIEVEIEELDYIQLTAANRALQQFLEKLSKAKTFCTEQETLHQIAALLQSNKKEENS